MTSPAARHMMRVSASETARRAAVPLRNATAYEQMLVKLAADNRTLKQIRSNERKADKKRELLPFYLPWVAGVLANGKGAQDDIVMTVMLWRLDADDIAGALEIARYAMTWGLTMPTGRRPTPYLLAEEVALAAQRLLAAKQPVELANLLDTIALTERADMPDIVRAKLHKITGYVLRDANQLPEALGNGAVVNGGLGLGVISGLGGNSIALGDNDTGFKQNGDGVLDVYANSKQVMRFLNSGITSYMLFNMNAGASVSSTLTFKNGSGITSEKTGANPRNGRIYWGGDASRGNRIEFADDAGWKAYIERHPSNGVQLVVNGRINGSIVYSSGEVLAGGGSARFAADGNIFGSKWGNQWLDAYLKNTYQPKGNYTPAGQAYTKAESEARYGGGKTTTGNNSAYYTHGNGAVFMQSVRNISVGNNATVTVTLPTSFPNGILGIGSSYYGAGGNNSASFYLCSPVGKNQVKIQTHNCNGTFYLNVTGY